LGPTGTGSACRGGGIEGAGDPARRRLCSNRPPAWEGCFAILSRLFRAFGFGDPFDLRHIQRFARPCPGNGQAPTVDHGAGPPHGFGGRVSNSLR
jgi:hypothetical protein